MRTLKQFQDEVLRPLREERDRKFMENYKKESEARTNYFNVKAYVEEEKREMVARHSEELLAVKERLAQERHSAELEWQKRKAQACDACRTICAEVKAARRTANETYNDGLSRACSEYNRERIAEGAPALKFDEAMRVVTEVEKDSKANA
jgi:hypothetical protein